MNFVAAGENVCPPFSPVVFFKTVVIDQYRLFDMYTMELLSDTPHDVILIIIFYLSALIWVGAIGCGVIVQAFQTPRNCKFILHRHRPPF